MLIGSTLKGSMGSRVPRLFSDSTMSKGIGTSTRAYPRPARMGIHEGNPATKRKGDCTGVQDWSREAGRSGALPETLLSRQ